MGAGVSRPDTPGGNVKHYGAVGDGKNDDTEAIQRAANAGVGALYLPKGFYRITQPIVIGDGAWICADVFIGPGVTVGANCVVTAGSVVGKDLPAGMVCSGNPCVAVKER